MSTPQPPGSEGQGWSEGWSAEPGPAGNPPTQEFAAQPQFGAPAYPGQPYQDPQYQAPQQYQDPQYQGQGYDVGADSTQYYAQQAPPPDMGSHGYGPPPGPSTPGWAWALLGLVIVGLLGGLGYFAATQLGGSDNKSTAAAPATTESADGTSNAPDAVTPSSRPTTRATTTRPTTTRPTQVSLPSNASPCPATQQTAEFSSSAVAGATSCPFAEEVRAAYLQQPRRGANIVVQAYSPTTKKMYDMTCTGTDLVVCTGGNSAIVYVY